MDRHHLDQHGERRDIVSRWRHRARDAMSRSAASGTAATIAGSTTSCEACRPAKRLGSSRFFISLEDDLIRRYGVMTLIPQRHRPPPQVAPIDDPVVRREIARAQRIIEGQNFEIRQTLWRYSALLDEQRCTISDWRESLLNDEFEPDICRAGAPRHYEALEGAVGTDAVRRSENRLLMLILDRHWSDHLALVETSAGIHLALQRPRSMTEFHRQIANAHRDMMEAVQDEAVRTFERLSAAGGAIDLARAGVQGPSSTWTYLVNDNPFSTIGISLLASRNIGYSAAVGVLAVMYAPISALAAAGVLLRRRVRRRSNQASRPGEDTRGRDAP
jgi:hypothetical protein